MKIFSNFDTNYKSDVVTKFVMEHGRDNVLVINRSSLFLWIEVNLPFLLYTIVFLVLLYGISFFRDYKDLVISNVLITFITLIYLLLLAPIIKRLIDYYCDFTIVTPTGVFLYNQRGILYRTTSAMNIENIRTVNVKKSTLLYALFNNGDIIFLSEWVDSDLWEAMVYYVVNPEEKRDKIEELFEKGRKSH
jgi:uncharacterized membrane protein YdbT with pleckstrin-like domain